MEKYLKAILFPFIERRNGEIWVSGNVLCRLDIKDHLLTVRKIDIRSDFTRKPMIEDKKQNVWMAKDEEGVYRLDSRQPAYVTLV